MQSRPAVVINITETNGDLMYNTEHHSIVRVINPRAKDTHKAAEELELVKESLCTAEVYLLRKLSKTETNDLRAAQKQTDEIAHLADQITKRIQQEIWQRKTR